MRAGRACDQQLSNRTPRRGPRNNCTHTGNNERATRVQPITPITHMLHFTCNIVLMIKAARTTSNTAQESLHDIASKVTPIAHQYGISEVYVFGSAARGEMTSDSDIDIVYSMKGTPRTYEIAQNIKKDLTLALGRPVDTLEKETLLLNAKRSNASQIFLDSIAPDLVRIV